MLIGVPTQTGACLLPWGPRMHSYVHISTYCAHLNIIIITIIKAFRNYYYFPYLPRS